MDGQRHHLLSPAAARLAALLTPEPVQLSFREAMAPAVIELQRLGVAHIQWGSEVCFISATRPGISFSNTPVH